MEKNEIKKALYKEKPIAMFRVNCADYKSYGTKLTEGTIIRFKIPFKDIGDNVFENEIPAQLLIRWIDDWS